MHVIIGEFHPTDDQGKHKMGRNALWNLPGFALLYPKTSGMVILWFFIFMLIAIAAFWIGISVSIFWCLALSHCLIRNPMCDLEVGLLVRYGWMVDGG